MTQFVSALAVCYKRGLLSRWALAPPSLNLQIVNLLTVCADKFGPLNIIGKSAKHIMKDHWFNWMRIPVQQACCTKFSHLDRVSEAGYALSLICFN